MAILHVALECKVKAIPAFFVTRRRNRKSWLEEGLRHLKNGRFTISELAHSAEVPTTTVRYYERVGLLRPEERSAGNYRLYGDESLQKLKFIRTAQAIGFTLEDVKTLLSTSDSSVASCRQIQSLIEERLGVIAQRLKDLRRLQHVLKSSREKCRETERADCCHVIETLRETSEAGSRSSTNPAARDTKPF